MKHKQKLDYAVLLAAGKGTRMGDLTKHCPKCLIPLNGRPLLDYWLEKCKKANIDHVYINGFYLAEQVEAFLEETASHYDFTVHYTREDHLTGTGGFLRAIRNELLQHECGFVCHADNFTDMELSAFMDFHSQRNSLLSVALFHSKTPKSCGIVEKLDENGRILEFREKPQDPKTDLASGAMFIITRQVLEDMPDQDVIDFSKEILPQYQGKMYGYVIPGSNIDIGTPESYAQALKTLEGDHHEME